MVAGKPTVQINREMTVQELADLLGMTEANVIKFMFNLGISRVTSRTVDVATATKLARMLGYIVEENDNL